MTATALIIILLVGAVAGWLAGLIVRGFGFGLLGNIVVGIIGAFIAGWLFPRLGISFMLVNSLVTSIVYAMLGAVVLLVIIGLIRRA
ncbi:MAG TPA: GlsB/YeaQ/YmgE family stress response membrane protein [Dyella sp.]|nr:GlsB/YeaQ/YmgE family stress response membrane protein [Dyella sp.]